MLEIASQMILCLLLAALLGFIMGYFFGKSTCVDDNGQDVDGDITSTVTNEGLAPALLSAPRNGVKDNLTRIKGIGVKIDETLNEIGIYHFAQIAEWTNENVTWVDANVAFPGRVKREEWVEQAKALSNGQETEFSKRVDAGEVSSSKKG